MQISPLPLPNLLKLGRMRGKKQPSKFLNLPFEVAHRDHRAATQTMTPCFLFGGQLISNSMNDPNISTI